MLLKSQRGNQLYNTVVLGVCREYQIFNEESIIYRHDYVHNLLILRATKSIPDTLLVAKNVRRVAPRVSSGSVEVPRRVPAAGAREELRRFPGHAVPAALGRAFGHNPENRHESAAAKLPSA